MSKSENRAGDVWGGVAATLVALPSSIAYGVVMFSAIGAAFAAQGALAGVIGAIALGILAPLFGGTPRLITSPSAPAAAVVAATAAEFYQALSPGTDPAGISAVLLLLAITGVATGILQLAIGAVGGGKLMKYIPYPVVAGFLSGVAIVIFTGQIPKFFGFPKSAGLWGGLTQPDLWRWPGIVVGLITIGGMVVAPKITRRLPAVIIALLGGIGAYFAIAFLVDPTLLSLTDNHLVIGPVGGREALSVSSLVGRWSAVTQLALPQLKLVFLPALTMAILLSLDTLKTCVIVDALTRSRSNANRELIGQGIGNVASGLIGGAPGSGTMGATLINLSSGAKTRFSGLVEGVLVLVVFLLFARWVSWIPLAALAGILLVVAYRMVDRDSFHLLKNKSTRLDFVVVAVVAVVTVSVDLVTAEAVGLGIAILLFLREQIREPIVRRKTTGDHTFSKKRRVPSEAAILEKKGEQTAIYELVGSLFFGTTDHLYTELESDLRTKTFVILDMRSVRSVDVTAAHKLDQIEAQLTERGAFLVFAGLSHHLPTEQNLQAFFAEVGLNKPSRNVKMFEELSEALEWVEDRILEEEGVRKATTEPPLTLGQFDLLHGLDAADVKEVEALAATKSFVPRSKIFSRGDKGDEVFLIRSGEVRINLPLEGGEHHHLATFARGDFFGDMSFLDHADRSADAVTSSATELYVLSRAQFDAFALRHPLVAKRVIARLARALSIRLRQTDTELRALEEA
ncbi:MAG: SLC26A/SulP transporter family protein [Nitrospirae bacterium]|nr:SLC26A/SulP transporter family protein [Nitrospirota bacterium]